MRTFVEKILNAERGSIVVREPDYVMSHDNSARVRFLFERIHGTRVYNPSQLVIVLDGKVSGVFPSWYVRECWLLGAIRIPQRREPLTR